MNKLNTFGFNFEEHSSDNDGFIISCTTVSGSLTIAINLRWWNSPCV